MKNSKKSYQNVACLIIFSVVKTDRQNGVLECICCKSFSTSWDSCDLNTNTTLKYCGKVCCIDLTDVSIRCSYFWFSFTEEMLRSIIQMPHLSWITVSVSGCYGGRRDEIKDGCRQMVIVERLVTSVLFSSDFHPWRDTYYFQNL